MKNKRIAMIFIVVLLILMIPLVLTLLGSGIDGDGWHWTLSDFIIMGTLMFIIGLALDFTVRKVTKKYRVIACIIIVIIFLLIWAELAVGIFGSPFAGS